MTMTRRRREEELEEELLQLYEILDERDQRIQLLLLEKSSSAEQTPYMDDDDVDVVDETQFNDAALIDLQVKVEHYESEMADLGRDKASLKNQCKLLQEQLDDSKKRFHQQAVLFDDFKRNQRVASDNKYQLELENQRLRSTLTEMENHEQDLVAELDYFVSQRMEIESSKDQVYAQTLCLQKELNDCKSERMELEVSVNNLTIEVKEARRLVIEIEDNAKKEVKKIKDEINGLESQLSGCLKRNQNLESQLSLMRNESSFGKLKQELERVSIELTKAREEVILLKKQKSKADSDLDEACHVIQKFDESKARMKLHELSDRKGMEDQMKSMNEKLLQQDAALREADSRVSELQWLLDKSEERNGFYEKSHGLLEISLTQKRLEMDLRKRDLDLLSKNEKICKLKTEYSKLERAYIMVKDKFGVDGSYLLGDDELAKELMRKEKRLEMENNELNRQIHKLESERLELLETMRKRAGDFEYQLSSSNEAVDAHRLAEKNNELQKRINDLQLQSEVDTKTIFHLEKSLAIKDPSHYNDVVVTDLKKQIGQLQEDNLAFQEKVLNEGNLRKQINSLTLELRQSDLNLNDAKKEVSLLKDENANLYANLRKCQDLLHDLKTFSNDENTSTIELNDAVATDLKKQIDRLQEDNLAFQEKVLNEGNLRNQINSLTLELRQSEFKLTGSRGEVNTLKDENKNLRSNLRKCQDLLHEFNILSNDEDSSTILEKDFSGSQMFVEGYRKGTGDHTQKIKSIVKYPVDESSPVAVKKNSSSSIGSHSSNGLLNSNEGNAENICELVETTKVDTEAIEGAHTSIIYLKRVIDEKNKLIDNYRAKLEKEREATRSQKYDSLQNSCSFLIEKQIAQLREKSRIVDSDLQFQEGEDEVESTLVKQLNEANNNGKEKDKYIDSLKKTISELKITVVNLENDVSSEKSRVESITNNLGLKTLEVEQMSQKLARMNDDVTVGKIVQMRQELRSKDVKLQRLRQALVKSKTKLRESNAKAQVEYENLKKNLDDKSLIQLKSDLEGSRKEVRDLTIGRSKLTEKLKQSIKREAELLKDNSRLEEQVIKLRKSITEIVRSKEMVVAKLRSFSKVKNSSCKNDDMNTDEKLRVEELEQRVLKLMDQNRNLRGSAAMKKVTVDSKKPRELKEKILLRQKVSALERQLALKTEESKKIAIEKSKKKTETIDLSKQAEKDDGSIARMRSEISSLKSSIQQTRKENECLLKEKDSSGKLMLEEKIKLSSMRIAELQNDNKKLREQLQVHNSFSSSTGAYDELSQKFDRTKKDYVNLSKISQELKEENITLRDKNKKLQQELQAFDLDFFEEIEELKRKYQRTKERLQKYEQVA